MNNIPVGCVGDEELSPSAAIHLRSAALKSQRKDVERHAFPMKSIQVYGGEYEVRLGTPLVVDPKQLQEALGIALNVFLPGVRLSQNVACSNARSCRTGEITDQAADRVNATGMRRTAATRRGRVRARKCLHHASALRVFLRLPGSFTQRIWATRAILTTQWLMSALRRE